MQMPFTSQGAQPAKAGTGQSRRPEAPVPAGSTPQSARRGRPPGSVSLTPEIQDKIVAFIRAGAFDYIAAQAGGIALRTFHDWMARGEGRHSTRPPTTRLRAFARAVRRAQAEARVVAETRVFRERPHWWLTHAARTRPGEEGWTTPRNDAGLDQHHLPTLEERLAEIGDSPSD
jgi:hypothetical protein